MKSLCAIFLAALSLFTSSTVLAEDMPCDNFAGTGLDLIAYKKFEVEFRSALNKRRPKEIAKFVQFPIEVRIRGKVVAVKSAKEFVSKFDEILSPAFLSTLETNTPSATVCREQGVGWSHGNIWVQAPNVKKLSDLRVTAINN